MKAIKSLRSLVQLALVLGILLVLNILGSFVYTDFDLTEDRRFTLNEATYRLMNSLKEPVFVEIYLEGEFPSSFRHLQGATRDLLDKLRSRGAPIEYDFINPLGGTDEENKEMVQQLRKMGIMPVNLTITSKGAREARLVFPAAVLRYRNQTAVVPLLQDMSGSINTDLTQMPAINASVNLLEYKFAKAIHKLQQESRPRIALLTGHGELDRPFSEAFEKNLFEYYDIGRLNLDSVVKIDTLIDLVIALRPLRPYTDKNLFKIDQYILQGGKMIWAVDMLNIGLDSIWGKNSYVPADHDIDVAKFLFNYGARINNNVVLDWESSSIPSMVGPQQMELRKWFYHPRAFPYASPEEANRTGRSTIAHPIVQNLDYVDMRYPSSIDTVKTKTPVEKTVLLRSSKYSKVQFPPVRVTTDILDAGIKQDAFNKGYQNLAVLLEGEFESYYRNRVAPEMLQGLQSMGLSFLERSSQPGKLILIGDADVARSDLNPKTGKPLALGMNLFDGYTYGNRDFLMNCVEYLVDDNGILGARSKEIKLRPLDQARAYDEELKWQLINLGLPLLVLLGFGLTYTFVRRRRYAR